MLSVTYCVIVGAGAFKAAIEQPLELLTVHGLIDEYEAAHIIENSSASVLFLLFPQPIHSFSPSVPPVVKELHLAFDGAKSLAVTIEGTNTLLAVTGLFYDQTNAPTTLRLIEKNIELQAIGLDIRTEVDADSTKLTRVLKSSQNIQSIVLNFYVFKESHMVMTLAILSEMTSLREIWLTFQRPVPDDNQLATLGQKVCSHAMLNSVSLLSDDDDFNISAFLEVLSDNNRRLSTVYTKKGSQLDSDLVKGATDRLVYVKDDFDSMYYTPLVYSQYLLTSVSSRTKDAIRKRYIS